jgi:hypothetical protein
MVGDRRALFLFRDPLLVGAGLADAPTKRSQF